MKNYAKVGGRKGLPGYRSPSVFRSNKSIEIQKNKSFSNKNIKILKNNILNKSKDKNFE